MIKEIWKKSDFGSGNYEFSNLGRVRNIKYKVFVKGVPNSAGYLRILNTRTKTRIFIHREIARLFLGECPKGLVVNHKDGNILNNSVENLEYISRAENMNHAITVLKKTKSTPIETIDNIVKDYKDGVKIFKLAKKYNCHRDTIHRILSNKLKNRDNQQPSCTVKYGRFND